MKKIFLLLLIFWLFNASFIHLFAQEGAKPFVVPAIKSWKSNHQNAIIKIQELRYDALNEKALMPYLETFKSDLLAAKYTSSVAIVKGKSAANTIYFTINTKPNPKLGAEGYELIIAKGIQIKANTALGAFWATRTLLQLREQNEKLPLGTIIDYPDYPLRGFVLDVGRKFFSIDFLRNYVKFMAYYKMNDFQIHLNDNGFKQFFMNDWQKTYSAFRLENETFPELTAKDGSYSKKEFKDLQVLAQNYGVRIVPEIDVPAHVLAITKAVPEIGSKKYGMDHLDLDNPKTYQVVDQIFKEYISGSDPVFKGEEVHIGTDEYDKRETEKFRTFTDHYIRYIESFGKKARLWGALTHAKGKTPVKVKNVTMNLWYNGYADPKDMIALGYDVISTPDAQLYIVPIAGYYADYLDNQKIYNEWAPNHIGNQTFKAKHPQIKGGSFAVWNDIVGNGISERDVHHRVFHSMQVLAQKMWSSAQPEMPFEQFKTASNQLSEGPDNYLSSKNFDQEHQEKLIPLQSDANQRMDTLSFDNKNNTFDLPYENMAYGYTVAFDINPSKGNDNNAVLFSNQDTEFKLKQEKTGQLGFSRDGYHFSFNYTVPETIWSHIEIIGNDKSTSLYVNGSLIDSLMPQRRAVYLTPDVMNTIQTLQFPLQRIGKKGQSFLGSITNLKIYNYEKH